MHRSSPLLLSPLLASILAVALAACGGSTEPAPAADAGPTADAADAACAPVPCPSFDTWDPVQCKCVQPAPIILHASDYDQSCAVADDCIPFTEGNVCPCACPNSAVNKSEQSRAQADENRAAAACVGQVACGACESYATACVAGKCGMALPNDFDAGH